MNIRIRELVLGPLVASLALIGLSACSNLETLPSSGVLNSGNTTQTDYRIGSDDSLQIFVWRNPDLSTSVSVRPDGKITIPLIEDLPATGKTPTQLARDIEKKLGTYVQDPIVTVIMTGFVGPLPDRIRVVGEATQPQSMPYRSTMTLLDVMIAVGGITDFAAGNRATITRASADGKQKQYRIRLDDLLRDGDMTANVGIKPGDIIIVPEAWF